VAFLKTMPVSPKTGQPLYSPRAIKDVFKLVAMRANGATMKEIRAVAKGAVALYPITKHCRSDGKRGWCWKLYIDGARQPVFPDDGFPRETIDGLRDDVRVRLDNFIQAKRHNDSHGWTSMP
jgi:hypothetical protein